MAGSTNFLQHNPTAANQESDSNYASDSLRTGGIGVDAILPSLWLNKIYYQTTTFVAAFAQMMANKGYTMSDASIANLEAVLANVLTTADTKPPLITVPFSSTPTFDASQANGFVITLSGNVTSSTLINQQIGQRLVFVMIQDGVGGRTFVPPTNLSGFIPLGNYGSSATGPNSVTIQTFEVLPNGAIVLETSYDFALFSSIIPTIQSNITNLQNGKQNNLGFTPVQQGGGAGQGTNKVYIGWTGSRLACQVDSTNEGNFIFDAQFDPLSSEVSSLSGTVSGLQSQLTTLINAFTGSLQTNGYYKFEGGLIIQWGRTAQFDTNGSVNFPIAFPNACLCAIVGGYEDGQSNRQWRCGAFSTTGMSVQNDGLGTGSWIAIGY